MNLFYQLILFLVPTFVYDPLSLHAHFLVPAFAYKYTLVLCPYIVITACNTR